MSPSTITLTLEHLYSKLNQYPNDKLYSFADVTNEDKKNFEELRKILREAYLYVAITTVVYQPLELMLPQLAIVLFIPLVIVAFIVFVLILGLIKQAENLLAA